MSEPSEKIDRHFLLYEHAAQMPSAEQAAGMVARYLQYARCWLDGDIDGVIGCLIAEPTFEQYPQRTRVVGRDAVRARAERLLPLLAPLDPRRTGGALEMRAVAFGPDVLAYESSSVFTLRDGTSRRCHLVTVVTFHGDAIAGERVYTDQRLADLVDDALGPDFGTLAGVGEIGEDGQGALEEGVGHESADSGTPNKPPSGLDCAALTDAAARVPTPQRAARLVDVNLEYAQCYLDGDFEGMFDSLIEIPEFEHFPRGLRIQGKDIVRERSRRSFASTMKQLDPRRGPNTHRIATSCAGEDMLIHEFSNVFTMPDGSRERCYLIAIIPFVDDRMVGERVYTDRHQSRLRAQNFGTDFEALPGATLI